MIVADVVHIGVVLLRRPNRFIVDLYFKGIRTRLADGEQTFLRKVVRNGALYEVHRIDVDLMRRSLIVFGKDDHRRAARKVAEVIQHIRGGDLDLVPTLLQRDVYVLRGKIVPERIVGNGAVNADDEGILAGNALALVLRLAQTGQESSDGRPDLVERRGQLHDAVGLFKFVQPFRRDAVAVLRDVYDAHRLAEVFVFDRRCRFFDGCPVRLHKADVIDVHFRVVCGVVGKTEGAFPVREHPLEVLKEHICGDVERLPHAFEEPADRVVGLRAVVGRIVEDVVAGQIFHEHTKFDVIVFVKLCRFQLVQREVGLEQREARPDVHGAGHEFCDALRALIVADIAEQRRIGHVPHGSGAVEIFQLAIFDARRAALNERIRRIGNAVFLGIRIQEIFALEQAEGAAVDVRVARRAVGGGNGVFDRVKSTDRGALVPAVRQFV